MNSNSGNWPQVKLEASRLKLQVTCVLPLINQRWAGCGSLMGHLWSVIVPRANSPGEPQLEYGLGEVGDVGVVCVGGGGVDIGYRVGLFVLGGISSTLR